MVRRQNNSNMGDAKGGNNNSRKRNNRPRKRKPKPYGGVKKAILIERNSEKIKELETKCRERFTSEETPMGFPQDMGKAKSFSFNWPVHPVSLKDEEIVSKIVVRKGEFGWLSDERVEEIDQKINPYGINLDQALSLRSALLQQKTVYSHGRMKARGKALFRLYKDGVSVIDLSKRFDFPPMNIFRLILSEMKWSKSRIKETLRAPSKFSERERKEFEQAEAADRVSNVDQSETQEKADLFEEILADWFESQGVRLRRQPEMVKEQMEEHGRPVRTPDILFLDHVEINGSPVAWIDAKHFYGADVDFQRKKMSKQMDRYLEEWGSGAVVYRHGFSQNLFMAGCTLLDAGPLDLSLLYPDE